MYVRFGRIGHKEPDPGILAQLREIDTRADALWVPGPLSRGDRWDVGRWWTPDARTVRDLVELLDRQFRSPQKARRPAYMRTLWDSIRGWKSMFHTNGPLDGRAVREFRERTWRHYNRFHAELDEALRYLESDEERFDEEYGKQIRDRIESDTWAYKRVIGHRMVHTHGIRDGMPFARGVN